ncbi:DNA-processing protein DprA [Streptomyces sp. NPDC058463]|uniref:DNA-processing protein DprA n=1 Tax=Streptomyces sp. NPDC058463 TaxID=3346510 RepID=UPI00365CD209
MMEFTSSHAFLLAASEVLPGDARDLSLLLREYSSLENFSNSSALPSGRMGALAKYIKSSVEHHRVIFWTRRLRELRERLPTVQLFTVLDSGYLSNLKAAYDRPPFMFARGTLIAGDEMAIAVVGSRRTTPDVIDAAASVSAELASAGIAVISGLALGVDSAAHEGALQGGGRTIAVLGHGIDQVQPASNINLANRVLERGALVSQFRPFSPPTSSTFPLRNAVISGSAKASLIMDATERSGTRSEAEASLRQGRPVLLWAPALGNQRWAQEFARQGNVSMVNSGEEVISAMTGGSDGAQLQFT